VVVFRMANPLASYRCKENIPPNSLLFVDGDSFLLHLIAGINVKQSLQTENFYLRLHEEILVEIHRLRLLGLTSFVFFFNGTKSRFKSVLKKEQRLEIQRQWTDLQLRVRDKNWINPLPIPRLSSEQLIISLLELGLPVRISEGECNQEMARACKQSNDRRCPCYCYCDPTVLRDFFLMKDCPTIAFSAIKGDATHLQAIVWRRPLVAKHLGLNETQLLSSLLFSESFKIVKGKDVPQENPGITRSLLSHEDTRLDQLLRYSRELFDLEDLSKYPFDDDGDDAEDQEPSPLTRESVIASYSGRVHLSVAGAVITPQYRRVLTSMVECTRSQPSQSQLDHQRVEPRKRFQSGPRPPRSTHSRGPKLSWEDLVVLDHFECQLKLLLRSLIAGLVSDTTWGVSTVRYGGEDDPFSTALLQNQVSSFIRSAFLS
jgi:hypothetical protein